MDQPKTQGTSSRTRTHLITHTSNTRITPHKTRAGIRTLNKEAHQAHTNTQVQLIRQNKQKTKTGLVAASRPVTTTARTGRGANYCHGGSRDSTPPSPDARLPQLADTGLEGDPEGKGGVGGSFSGVTGPKCPPPVPSTSPPSTGEEVRLLLLIPFQKGAGFCHGKLGG